MTTVKQNNPAPQQKAKPVAPAAKPAAKKTTLKPIADQTFLFDKDNYMYIIIGIVLILLGFVLMAGGKSADPHQFKYEEIYSFRRITLAPIVMLIGFGLEVYAIMKKPKESATSTPTV